MLNIRAELRILFDTCGQSLHTMLGIEYKHFFNLKRVNKFNFELFENLLWKT